MTMTELRFEGERKAEVSSLSDAQIWKSFLTPVRIRESARERAFLETARSTLISFAGSTLAVFEWGRGPSVFLMHGWGGRAANFELFVPPLLARGYRVVAVDGPGHGRSSVGLSSLFRFADVVEFMTRRNRGFHAIAAHSMGAASAAMAGSRGIDVGRLVLVAPICRLWDVTERFANRLGLSEVQRTRLIDALAVEFGADIWEKSSLAWVGGRLTMPGLVVHDRDDAEIPYSDAVDTASAWNGAELVSTAHLGHQAILRDASVIELVVDFVAGAEG